MPKKWNKSDLVDRIRKEADLTKDEARDALDAFMDAVTEALSYGDKVSLVGFGTFETRHRKARKGRNPQTNEEMTIPAKDVPAFRAGKNLKEAAE